MSERPSTAVLGFRPHTYWTAVVALAGPPEAPQVLERRRLVFATGAERFVYHQAETLDLRSAQALLDTVRAATEANAAREIGTLVADLERDGVAVRAAVTAAATAKLAGSLAAILKSHAQMHAAEGSFYRDVVAQACAALGLQVHRVAERDMPRQVCGLLHVDSPALEAQLKAIGAALGPPWSEDYRLATEAAWTQLDS
ncbi:MAG: hypothetical protein ACREE0_14825 [Phenylobacterium sp.]